MILDDIVREKKRELDKNKKEMPLEIIQDKAFSKSFPLDLVTSLKGKNVRLIAEVKQASPSRGIICRNFNPVEIARIYAESGAVAISVLTETRYFLGNLSYLELISKSLKHPRPPLIRKDFIFDPYQIYESRAAGADAILLIAAILNPDKLQEMLELSHQLHMKCIVEVHDEKETQIAVKSGASIIGINNRDLKSFQIDLSTTERLRPLIPEDRIVVSESGIKERNDIQRLERCGINAVLVGESLMTSENIRSRIKELL